MGLRWFGRRRREDDLAREIESYLAHEADRQMEVRAGLTPAEARGAARRRLGNQTLIGEEVYEMNGIALETLWADVRYGWRVLWKSKGFTAVAILSLALGIGFNSVMFSLIHAVLLRSLPYPEPERLVRVARVASDGAASMPEYEFWKENTQTLEAVAGERGTWEARLSGSGQEWIQAKIVTADFLRTLGVPPAMGREFSVEETKRGGPQALVLTHGLWQRSFGGDPGVLGRAVRLDDTSYTVVGVLPAGFWMAEAADALVPLRANGNLGDTGMNTRLIARLKRGVTIQQAQAEMSALTERFRQTRLAPDGARNYRGLTVTRYQDSLVGDVRMNLLLLFGATGLVLLLSCSNLATLLLTRFAARGQEVAVRLALGGSRGRLVRQFFVENLLIAAMGAGAGLAAAYILLRGLGGWMPFALPASAPIALNPAVLAFTLGVATATAIAFTVVPLGAARRLNVRETLQAAGRSGGGDLRGWLRRGLIIGEVAISTTLLIAAGLLIHSLYRMYQERLGFVPQGLITFQTPLKGRRQEDVAERQRFVRALSERLRTVPGVGGVAATNVLPLVGWGNLPAQRDGHPEQSIGGMEVRSVTPEYFEMMGIPMKSGRAFHAGDREGSSPVVIVNETVARRWWGEGRADGERVLIGWFRGKAYLKDPRRDVIGVVADTKTRLQDAPWPTVYVPLAQTEELPVESLTWVVRLEGAVARGESLRRAVSEVDAEQRVRQMRTMEEILSATTASSRFNTWLFGAFAGVALLLAALGVYGLQSFVAASRRREIGTRIALGATRGNVLGLFFRQGLVLTGTGLVLGLGGAWFASRWLAALLHGVKGTDWRSFLAAAGVLLAAALAATWIPARRATRIDPMTALRYE